MKSYAFEAMLEAMAAAWTRKDYGAVCEFMDADVRYSDPTRYALCGVKELRAFFDDDSGHEQHCRFHNVVFDEKKQLGAAEYTYRGTHQYHGMVLVKIRDGKISHWREYQHADARDWGEFTAATKFSP